MRYVVDDKEEGFLVLFICLIQDTNGVRKSWSSVSAQFDFLTQCIARTIPAGPVVLNLSFM